MDETFYKDTLQIENLLDEYRGIFRTLTIIIIIADIFNVLIFH